MGFTRHLKINHQRRFALKTLLTAIISPNLFKSKGALGAAEDVALDAQPGITLNVVDSDGSASYNGKIPGQTIYSDPGADIHVSLINKLPPLHDDCTGNHNSFHGLNTTNLHTHGLHVSPTKDSSGTYEADNLFLNVTPKNQKVTCKNQNFRDEEAHYRFEISDDHPTGTFWYHAHKHGSTASQVGGGLAGPLIIRDRQGEMPRYIEEAEEKIFMITGRGLYLMNPEGGGELNPILNLRPGEVQRWRIINSGVTADSFYHLPASTDSLEFYQIAFDGLTLDKRVFVENTGNLPPWLNPTALVPGNRTDLMVRVPKSAEPQTIEMSALKSLAQFLNVDMLLADTREIKFRVRIEGEAIDSEWSDDPNLPGCGLKTIDEPIIRKRSIAFGPGNRIDGEFYSGEVKQTMKLGTAEEWTISNRAPGAHPFHIHVNPFFVTHINGEELPEESPLRRWQDTLAVPGNSGGTPGSVTFKSRFTKFTGKFVIHCHILRHEDLGMMQAVEVVA